MARIVKITIKGTPRTVHKNKKKGYTQWEAKIIDEMNKKWKDKGKDPIDSKKIKLDITIKLDKNTGVNLGHGPDIDNFLKPILDGVAKTILTDSNQTTEKKHPDYLVYELNVKKKKCRDEGIEIVVSTLE